MSGDGEWYANGPMVVDKYTQTGQRWLRAKTVKSGHSRRYKRRLLSCTKKREEEKGGIITGEGSHNRKQGKRKERKDKRKNRNKERKDKTES